MIKPQDFFGASPKSILSRPFFHAQDQKAYNVDGGSSIADAWTKRTLNTVIYNDIQGATLSSDAVNLPAGTYYVEGKQLQYMSAATGTMSGIFKDASIALREPAGHIVGGNTAAATVAGVVTLTVPGTIDLRYYVGAASLTEGLGRSNNTSSITDASINSIYADLKIWQLDRSLEIAPKAINSGLQTISGMNTEGNIMGFDVTVSGNTLTITKGSCMSSDLTVVLAFTANKTCVLPGTVNGDFYVFAVRLLDGVTFEPRAYSTYAGPSSDAQIDKWRLVSFAKNNGSGVTYPYKQSADRIDWLVGNNRPILTATTTASYVSYNVSSILPNTIFSDFTLIAIGGSSGGASYDGTTDSIGIYPGSTNNSTPIPIAPVSSIYIKNNSAALAIHFGSATLRR